MIVVRREEGAPDGAPSVHTGCLVIGVLADLGQFVSSFVSGLTIRSSWILRYAISFRSSVAASPIWSIRFMTHSAQTPAFRWSCSFASSSSVKAI